MSTEPDDTQGPPDGSQAPPDDAQGPPGTAPDGPQAPPDGAASPVAADLDDVLLVAATLAATPFLQAISTYFGNALAKGMSSGTREILRRFIHRRARAALDEPGDVVDTVFLRTEDGWQIEMSVDIEPAALAQLPALCDAGAPLADAERRPGTAATIRWSQGRWLAATVRETGYQALFTWDAEAERWRERLDRRPVFIS